MLILVTTLQWVMHNSVFIYTASVMKSFSIGRITKNLRLSIYIDVFKKKLLVLFKLMLTWVKLFTVQD